MATTVDRGVKNIADEEKASSPKRSRSGSPIAAETTTITKDDIISIAAAIHAAPANAPKDAKLLEMTKADIHVLRENSIFTSFAHREAEKLFRSKAAKYHIKRDYELEAVMTERAIEYLKAYQKWQDLYEDATRLKNALLLGTVTKAEFNARLDDLLERKKVCNGLVGTYNKAYQIARADLNSWWYEAEEKQDVAMGYAPAK
jgi:hypothetical protein